MWSIKVLVVVCAIIQMIIHRSEAKPLTTSELEFLDLFDVTSSPECFEDRIFDARGKISPLKKMGGMAALYKHRTVLNSTTYICGAALLTPRYLLTAAHCVIDQKKESLSLSLGKEDLDEEPCPGIPDNTYGIQNVIIHHAYKRNISNYNDLSILRTDRDVKFSDKIWVFCLPEVNLQLKDYDLLEIAGWGQMTHRKNDITTFLQTADVPLVENSRCEDKFSKINQDLPEYPEGLTNQILCAGGDGVSACKGDSGGPLLHKNELGQQTLIGIIAEGIPCTKFPRSPSFYTNLKFYIDWINDITDILQLSTTNICGLPPDPSAGQSIFGVSTSSPNKQGYKAHPNKYWWWSSKCPASIGLSLDICREACSTDPECNVFAHLNSGGGCIMWNCSGSASRDKPGLNKRYWTGYSLVSPGSYKAYPGKFWSTTQCPVSSNALEMCKKMCQSVADCTAFNYDGRLGGCNFRNCVLPVTEPTDKSGWTGYSLDTSNTG